MYVTTTPGSEEYSKENPLKISCTFAGSIDDAKQAIEKALMEIGLTRKQYMISDYRDRNNGKIKGVILKVPKPFSETPEHSPSSITKKVKYLTKNGIGSSKDNYMMIGHV